MMTERPTFVGTVRRCYILAFLMSATSAGAKIEWKTLETTLPKPISDHTATRWGDIVYIAGGCDAEEGNKWVEEAAEFLCLSISSSFFGFNIITNTSVTGLPDMPIPRFRHAAAAANNKIWIVGGRFMNDTIIKQIDVYDIATNTWSTVGNLPEQYVTSDNTGFSWQNRAYFVGGYSDNYTALNMVFSIDGTSSSPLDSVKEHAPMQVERADIASALDRSRGIVLVAGGFTHSNNFCEPHNGAELYDIKADQWTTLPEMTYARADKAVVHLPTEDGIFYVMGGERQVVGFCELNVKAGPGEWTIPIDQVEKYNHKSRTWTTVARLPVHRFRFPALAEGNAVYAFGGQFAFNQKCDCFKTTDEIVVYTEFSRSNPIPGIVVNSLLAVVGGLFLLFG